jgi:arginine decarboxylase
MSVFNYNNKDNILDSKNWCPEQSRKHYLIQRWSDGFYSINDQGNISIIPHGKESELNIDMMDVIEDIKSKNIQFPLVLRFHDILRKRVKNLNKIFKDKIEKYDYRGKFYGVYPIKVNQLREVVEEVIDAGSEFSYGLEAGSKAELLSVLAKNKGKDCLTICNGYKDIEYLKLALLGAKLEKKIIIVIEKFSELPMLMDLAKEKNIDPKIGIRVKLSTKGSGKWASSTGDRAKFGLTIAEILKAWNYLKEIRKQDCLELIHFHIGSQIPDIRTIKEALIEGARVYTKLSQIGAKIKYFDVGGGVGIDYDGSKSNSNSSVNYTMKDYISDVVFILKDICDQENVDHPNIVCESGRAISAHHSLVVTKVFGNIDFHPRENTDKKVGEHNLVTSFRVIADDIHKKNYREAYYDVISKKEEAHNAFKLGILSLEDKAKIENLFWKTCLDINKIISTLEIKETIPKEIQDLKSLLSEQYLCNFSVFQSIPDAWAIKQVLPILPLHRHNETPNVLCSLADITCDSDGKVAQFINENSEITNTLSLHPLIPDEEYYIGFFLTGAYQDVMGDMHNLFGRLNEVHIFADDKDSKNFYIEETIKGQTSSDVLEIMQYNPEVLVMTIKQEVDKKIKAGKIKAREGVDLIDFYEECLKSYTYLS